MSRGSVDMNFLFTLAELQRVVRAYADKEAARYGITRAQWAVLAKVDTEALQSTASRYQIQSLPTLAVFQDGQEVARDLGARPASAIVSMVR